MALHRRHFLLGAASTATLRGDASGAAEKAHREIWRRFIDEHGVMLDFTELDGRVSLPAPEECRDGMEPPTKPGPDGSYPVLVPGRTKLI